jgi:hypothetical protein
MDERINRMHQLDAKVRDWWARVPPSLCLDADTLACTQSALIPKLLLINAAYHQCLCALHSSVVPLFSWGPSTSAPAFTRQISAQIAYDSSCAITQLLDLASVRGEDVSDYPSFIGFAAYCSFAVQAPFKWCLDPTVRERAERMGTANMNVVSKMARYWRSIALLVSQVL